jgi:four helix bundle protein
MSKINRFEDLDVWKAVEIGVDVYKLTGRGKLQRDFPATDQLRRAAISISNNIAEGFEYHNPRSFVKFLNYAKGSDGELRSNLYVLKEAELEADEYFEEHKRLYEVLEGF